MSPDGWIPLKTRGGRPGARRAEPPPSRITRTSVDRAPRGSPPRDGEPPMAKAHDEPVLAFRGHLEAAGQPRAAHHERVVAGRLEGARQPREDTAPVVLDEGRLPMDGLGRPRDDPTPHPPR